MRTIQLFNDNWLFAPRKLDLSAPDEKFESVVLPHTNKVFAHRSVDAAAYQFVSTYRKHFRLPENPNGRLVFLDFDGAMVASTVYLNDQWVGEHLGGYTPFSFDVTPYLNSETNVLTVYLDSTERPDIPPFGNVVDYLTFGGIYRDAFLRVVHPCHIQHVFARPIQVLTSPRLACDIKLSEYRPDVSISGILTDRQGAIITSAQHALSQECSTLTFPEPLDVELWSLDTPTLYTLELALFEGTTALDTVRTRIGFREAEFRPEGGFYLNGESIKLVGLNRHQTYPYIGAAAPARLQRQDADILKYELGCHIVRTSHYPQSPHFLDRCDEIGLLVFEEIPGWQHIGDRNWQRLLLRDLTAMIERDRNHPSIILWGVRINESPDHSELYTQTNKLAHDLDPTRQTGGVRNSLDSEFLEDVFTYNDFSNTVLPPVHQPHLITEFAGHMFPTKSWDHEERRIQHALLHANVQNLQIGCDKSAGAIGWCAFDYNTHREFGSGDRICHHGVMDIYRLPKWAAYVYRSQLPPEQAVVLLAATHWTLGDRSGGGNNPLIVFSNCEEIEVCIGKSSMGRFQPDRAAYGHLPHPPFTVRWPKDFDFWGQTFADLRIVGYINGEAVAEQMIASDHIPNALRLEIDTPRLQADGSDMTRLIVKITDRYGNILPYTAYVVQIQLEGHATLIGENPLPLLGGQAALYVQSQQQSGSVQITASTPSLPPVSIDLFIENSKLSQREPGENL
jgi:beta-galactosidase